MVTNALIGLDLGTSSTKAVIIDDEGQLLARAASEYQVDVPQQGWAEQDPEVWVGAAVKALDLALSRADITPDVVSAIGLSGQMHGTVCVDRQGRVLRPAIIWADQRSHEQVARVYREVGERKLRQWTANPLSPGFTLASWLWLTEEEPATFKATAQILLPKDYLRYRFTGRWGTEPSDASSTLMFDPVQRCWSSELLHFLGINKELLPPIGGSATVGGGLKADIANATGLLDGTPVIYGGSDQASQALGHGVIDPGVAVCTIGTGGQIFVPVRKPVSDSRLRYYLFCHVLPDRWHLEAAILSAGLALRWLRDSVFRGESYDSLAEAAASAPAGSDGLLFLPHLVGQRHPHGESKVRGSFLGLTLRHDRRHLVRAVMEGVVFALRQSLELVSDLDVPVDRVVASGGGRSHPLWLRLIADVFGRQIYQTETVEAASFGAALLAGVGSGVYADISAAIQRTVRWSEDVVRPLPRNVETYESVYQDFRQLDNALGDVGHHADAAAQ